MSGTLSVSSSGASARPSGWTDVALGELAHSGSYALAIGPFGSNLKVADYRPSGIPLVFVREIRARSFGDRNTKYVSESKADELIAHTVQPGDLLVTKMGEPPGDTAIYPASRPPAVITADCIKFSPDPRLTTASFLELWLRAPAMRSAILRESRGVAQQKVSLGRFRGIKTRIPPLPEQHRIVEALDSYLTRLDAAEKALRRAEANLQRTRASVLKAAVEGKLVPSEAELAEAEGRDYEPASALLERILTERRRRWEESELATMEANGESPKNDAWKKKYKAPAAPDTSALPKLPEGWCWATIGQIGDAQLGKMLDKKKTDGVNYPYLRNINVRWGAIETDDLLSMPFPQQQLERYSLKLGDVLVCEGGEPGRAAIWKNQNLDVKYQKALHRVRTSGAFLPEWLVHHLSFDSNRGSLANYFTGTTIKHFTLSAIREYRIRIPPLREQRRIVDAIDSHLTHLNAAADDMGFRDTAARGHKRIQRLRQSILQWAFEGKLVNQDPNDEPASVLLERIRAEREAQAKTQPRRKRKQPRGKAQKELFAG